MQGLVIEELDLALDRLLAGKVGEGDEVLGVDGDAAAIWLNFV